MDNTKPLTVEEIRAGVAAAVECRRVAVRHTAQLGGFMGGLGLLLVGAGYVTQGQVSLWLSCFRSHLLQSLFPRRSVR